MNESELIRSKALELLSKEYHIDNAIKKKSSSIVFFVCALVSTIALNNELETFSKLIEVYCFYKTILSYMESMIECRKATGETNISLYMLIKIKERILKYKEFFRNEELYKKYFNEISNNNLVSIDFNGEIEDIKNITYLKLRKLTKMITKDNM